MVKLFVSLITVLIFCQCNDDIKEIELKDRSAPFTVDVLHSNPEELETIERQLGPPTFLKFKGFDSSFMIASIKKMIIFRTDYYILDDRFSTLNRFDSVGNLISSFGKIGLGYNEFSKITDFDIDTVKNSVIIFSTENNALYYYSFSGVFIKKKYVGVFGSQYCTLDNDNSIFYRNFSAGLKGKNHNLLFIDSIGDLKGTAFSFDSKNAVIAWESTGFLRTTNKTTIFCQAFSDSVFEYKSNVLSPLFNIIIGSKNLLANKANHRKLLGSGILLDSLTSYLCSQFFFNKDFLVFNYQSQKKIKTIILNRFSKKMWVLSPDSKSDALVALFLTPIYLDDENNLFFKFEKREGKALIKKDPLLFNQLNEEIKYAITNPSDNNGAFIIKIKLSAGT